MCVLLLLLWDSDDKIRVCKYLCIRIKFVDQKPLKIIFLDQEGECAVLTVNIVCGSVVLQLAVLQVLDAG